MIGIVSGHGSVDEIADLKKVDVIFRVSLFAGTGEHDPFIVVTDPRKKFAHFRKGSHLWEILFSKQIGPVIIQFLAKTLDLVGRKKLG